jgi:hypothetical protein
MPPRPLDRGNEIGIRDGRQHRPDPVAGALGEEAREPPVAPLDDAAGGRRGRLVDLGDPERGGIDDRDVAAAPHDMDRVLRRRLIQLVPGRVALHVQAGLIVSARRHPGARPCRGGAVPNLREEGCERRRLPRPHVELGHRQADRQKVQMSVVETGAREAAAQIDDARRPADQGFDLAVAAGREHPPPGDRQRRCGTLGEAAEDPAVQ